MKILILGAGQVGSTAAFSLAREEANEVTIVDRNPDALRELQDRLDVRTVVGNAVAPRRARARRRRATPTCIIALTSSDEINMLACQIALHAVPHADADRADPRARAHRAARRCSAPAAFPSTSRSARRRSSPTTSTQLIRFPGALQVLDFADGKRAARCDAGRIAEARSSGHPLRELPKHIPNVESRVVAIYRGGQRHHPGRRHRRRGRRRGVLHRRAQGHRARCCARCASSTSRSRKVVIAGGGNIGLDLARTLEGSYQVKIIERDWQRARRISDQLARDRAARRLGGRGAAARGEHRQRRRVRRGHERRGGEHPVGDAREAARRA